MRLSLKNNYGKIGDMVFCAMKLKWMIRRAWLVLRRLVRRAVGRDMKFRLRLDVEIEVKAQENDKDKGEVEKKKVGE